MPSLKDIKLKIGGIKKTQQITKAMNMVAAAKLRGAQEKMEDFRPYADKFATVMGELGGSVNPEAFPLMAVRPVNNILLIVVTADRGLCGAFNANIINAAQKFARTQTEEGKKVSFACIGKKGYQNLRNTDYEVVEHITDCMAAIQMQDARKMGQVAINNFLQEKVDQVQLLYGRFINVVTQKPTFKQLLPISKEGLGGEEEVEGGPGATYIYEPEPEQILNQLMPMYVNVQIMAAMLETAASEQAARMTAMDNATRACEDMLHSLTLSYNKARQAAITKELMDIVGGAEALKG